MNRMTERTAAGIKLLPGFSIRQALDALCRYEEICTEAGVDSPAALRKRLGQSQPAPAPETPAPKKAADRTPQSRPSGSTAEAERCERRQMHLDSLLEYKERQEKRKGEKKRKAREKIEQRRQDYGAQGAVYRALRERANLTQQQIADKLGLQKAAISKREKGMVRIDPETYVRQICELASLPKSVENYYLAKARDAVR